MKACSKCGLTGEPALFITGKNICKPCNNARRRAAYRQLSDADREELLRKNRSWRSANIEAVRAQKRKYERANKASAAERSRRFRTLRADYVSESKRRYHEDHAEQIRQKVCRWRRQNLDKKRASNARRRAADRNAAGADYTTAEHIAWRWAMWGGQCWVCGVAAEATDHVIPLNTGGPHWPSNLRPICKSCNSRRKKCRPDMDELATWITAMPSCRNWRLSSSRRG